MRRLAVAAVMLAVAACSDSPASVSIPASQAGSLVIESREVRQTPGVIPCAPPEGHEPGYEGNPIRSGFVSAGDAFPTPAEALQAFVALDPPDGSALHFADSGYVEMRFPESVFYTDGKYVIYGRDFAYGWVTLIGVHQTTEGWAVTWWAGSGCFGAEPRT
jgi:hypothetical protein